MNKRLEIVCCNSKSDYVGLVDSEMYDNWKDDPHSKQLFRWGGHAELWQDDYPLGKPIEDFDDLIAKVEKISNELN